MPRENQREKLLTRRTALLAGGQAVLGVLLAARMYQLQILEKDRYTVLADENRINLRLVAPSRGRIVDRFGVALAANRQDSSGQPGKSGRARGESTRRDAKRHSRRLRATRGAPG